MRWICLLSLAVLKVALLKKLRSLQEWGMLTIYSSLLVHVTFDVFVQHFSAYRQWSYSNFRYAYPWWKEKVINSFVKRKDGLCPLTPEEIALVLRALGIGQNMQIYIAAGEIYGGKRRMASLTSAYPNVVWTKWLNSPITPLLYCAIINQHVSIFLLMAVVLTMMCRFGRRKFWNLLISCSFRTIHHKWQHWTTWYHWKVTFLFQHMMATWLKLSRATAGIYYLNLIHIILKDQHIRVDQCQSFLNFYAKDLHSIFHRWSSASEVFHLL